MNDYWRDILGGRQSHQGQRDTNIWEESDYSTIVQINDADVCWFVDLEIERCVAQVTLDAPQGYIAGLEIGLTKDSPHNSVPICEWSDLQYQMFNQMTDIDTDGSQLVLHPSGVSMSH